VGSGIVIDSDAGCEFDECMLKAKFLTELKSTFQLFETMLWNGYYLFLKEHLSRMRDSASYFGFVFNQAEILKRLKEAQNRFHKNLRYRVWLCLAQDGAVELNLSLFDAAKRQKNYFVAISKKKTDPDNVFYYHKTTLRSLYDEEYRRHASAGFADVVFLNERGEVSEGAISNIIVQKNGHWYTPPVSSGLLPGVLRNYLIKNAGLREKVIYPDELLCAKRVLLCNSVRGLTEVLVKRI